MNELKVSLKELKKNIVLKNEWFNIDSTNCYAFALGLDIDNSIILDNEYIYDLGTFGKYKYSIDSNTFNKLSYEKKLFIDLNSLGIEFKKVDQSEPSICGLDQSGCLSWVIALYEAYGDYISDFHFFRKDSNGVWYQKRGTKGIVTNKDDNEKVITDLNDMFIYDLEDEYKYNKVGVYRLRLKRD